MKNCLAVSDCRELTGTELFSVMSLISNTLLENRCRIVRLLGEGGYGAVYLAEDIRLGGKYVALKENFSATAK